jgi:hypothetical protein
VKICIKCFIEKEDSEFRYRLNRTGKYSHLSTCKICERVQNKILYYKNHTENKEKLRHKIRKSSYGLSKDDYESLLTQQNYSCAICSTTSAGGRGSWHVDHDHITGKVRGLLCHCCNTGLGLFKDSQELLLKAKDYLHECQ